MMITPTGACGRYTYPHALYVLIFKTKDAGSHTNLLLRIGGYVYNNEKCREAEKAFSEVMQFQYRFLGPEHPKTSK